MSEVRKKAWATRRDKYGPRGHAGSYSRSALERRALKLIVRLHHEGVLTEGQCSSALEMDRVDFRRLADSYVESPVARGARILSGHRDGGEG